LAISGSKLVFKAILIFENSASTQTGKQKVVLFAAKIVRYGFAECCIENAP
jgi:hypothetical protein